MEQEGQQLQEKPGPPSWLSVSHGEWTAVHLGCSGKSRFKVDRSDLSDERSLVTLVVALLSDSVGRGTCPAVNGVRVEWGAGLELR